MTLKIEVQFKGVSAMQPYKAFKKSSKAALYFHKYFEPKYNEGRLKRMKFRMRGWEEDRRMSYVRIGRKTLSGGEHFFPL